jgi:hypothetical protein
MVTASRVAQQVHSIVIISVSEYVQPIFTTGIIVATIVVQLLFILLRLVLQFVHLDLDKMVIYV